MADAGKDVGKRQQLFTAGGDENWYSRYGNKCAVSSQS